MKYLIELEGDEVFHKDEIHIFTDTDVSAVGMVLKDFNVREILECYVLERRSETSLFEWLVDEGYVSNLKSRVVTTLDFPSVMEETFRISDSPVNEWD